MITFRTGQGLLQEIPVDHVGSRTNGSAPPLVGLLVAQSCCTIVAEASVRLAEPLVTRIHSAKTLRPWLTLPARIRSKVNSMILRLAFAH